MTVLPLRLRLLLLLVGGSVSSARALTLSDGQTTVGLDSADSATTFGELTSLSGGGGGGGGNLIAARGGGAPVWAATFVSSAGAGEVPLDSRTLRGTRTSQVLAHNSAVFRWETESSRGAAQPAAAVALFVQLVGGQLEYRLQVSAPASAEPVAGQSEPAGWGLWSWTVTPVGALALPAGSSLFENAGFGLVHSPPATFSGIYPQHTMQYMAAYGLGHGGGTGVYVAAHDPTAASKTFSFAPTPHPLLREHTTGAFAVGATPPGAGLPLTPPPGTRPQWPIVVKVFQGSSWWDASQIYRSWVLAHGSWTKQGPMLTRTDIPQWMYNLTTWVNSHWQQNDIFNISGGDPAVTANRVSAIADRFKIAKDALALHWYEWDVLGYAPGSNYTKCKTEVTCGFDTHYPEYFPVREGFEAALKSMQALGVRVAPYINGRIFDKGTASWTADNNAAQSAAAKKAAPALGGENLGLYDESYGSLAKFAVMCPHTSLWQRTLAEVVDKLANTFGTDGIYIDQIAAAGPRPCWDPAHSHTLGGGDHWVTGYTEMLRQVRTAAGSDKILLTESNSEPFMNGINLFLTLVGFATGDLPGGPGTTVMVPAFQAVYGGYVLPVGAEFFQADFVDPNVFAAKIAAQYVFGAQLGWFSLGGRDNQHPSMGIHELLLDPAYDPEIFYLQALSAAKQLAAPWFNHGRMMRPLTLKLNQTDGVQAVSIADHPRESGRSRDGMGDRHEHDGHDHDGHSHDELAVSSTSTTGIGYGAVMVAVGETVVLLTRSLHPY